MTTQALTSTPPPHPPRHLHSTPPISSQPLQLVGVHIETHVSRPLPSEVVHRRDAESTVEQEGAVEEGGLPQPACQAGETVLHASCTVAPAGVPEQVLGGGGEGREGSRRIG